MSGEYRMNPNNSKTGKPSSRSASQRKRRRANSAVIKRNRIIAIVAVCSAILAVLVAIVAGWFYYSSQEDNQTILRGITVAGVDIGGMTKNDAISAISLATQHTFTEVPMIVTVKDMQVTILPEESGAKLDIPALVETVCAYTSIPASCDVDIIPYLHLDESAIQEKLNILGEAYSSTLSDTTWEILGQTPSLVPGEELENDTQVLRITIGTPEYGLDMDALYDQVLSAYNTNTFDVEAECSEIIPDPLDLAPIHDQVHTEPIDAVMDMKTFEVSTGSNGYTFDLSAAEALLAAAQYGEIIEIPFVRIPQHVTADMLSGLLYRDILGTYTASSASDENRDVNLRLACEAIDGIVLNPGDEFSYNETLGERTEDKGYMPGASYVGNDTVYSVGGGICQVSSALYYCTMVADLKITERDFHGFATTYMPLGMDSTINWGTIDFKFVNTTQYPIRIEASATGGTVTVRLVGTDTKDYYVKMEYEVLNTKPYSTSYQVMSADNSEGYKDGDVIVTPYTGYDVNTYRCKYDKETDALISKDFEAASYYRKRDEVICKIKEQPIETDPSPTEPEPTDPAPSDGVGGTVEEDGGGELP